MAFGFDASLILPHNQPAEPTLNETVRTLSDLASARSQRQVQGATLADLVRRQQQEQRLADIYRANAQTPDALPGQLFAGGFGQQGFAAQDQAAQMQAQRATQQKALRDIQDAERKHVGELFYGVKDQAGWDAAWNQVPEHYRGMKPESFDPAVAQRLGNLALPASERAKLEQDAYSLTSNPVTGSVVRLNRKTGDTATVEAGGPARPLGSGPLKPNDIEDQFKALSEAVSTNRGRSNLNLDRQKRLDATQRLEALVLGENGQIQNLTKQQLKEASVALANLIANGQVTQGLIEELTPESNSANWNDFKQKLFNEPQGADAQKFLGNMLDTAAREKKVTLQQLREAQLQGLPNFAHLRGINRERYESILKGAGLSPGDVDDRGLLKAKPEGEAQPPNGHQRIKQNNIWFSWNPRKRKYEAEAVSARP